MKKLSLDQLKNLKYILGYWIVFVIGPFLVSMIMNAGHKQNTMVVPILLYIIFIAPLLYFIPYLLSKLKSKLLFVIWGLVIPYLFIYLFILKNLLHLVFRSII
jgi:hypothetical protein